MEAEEHLNLYYLLTEWKLTHLFSYLRDQNITLEELLFLTEDDINKLFENLPIGEQAVFEYQLKVWKSEVNHGPCLNDYKHFDGNAMYIKLEDTNETKSENTINDDSNCCDINSKLMDLMKNRNVTIKSLKRKTKKYIKKPIQTKVKHNIITKTDSKNNANPSTDTLKQANVINQIAAPETITKDECQSRYINLPKTVQPPAVMTSPEELPTMENDQADNLTSTNAQQTENHKPNSKIKKSNITILPVKTQDTPMIGVEIIRTELPHLLTILKDTNEWKIILEFYEHNHNLLEEQRQMLINTIAEYIQENNYNGSLHNCKKLVRQICMVFPNEKSNKLVKKLHRKIRSLKKQEILITAKINASAETENESDGNNKLETGIECLRNNAITTDEFEVYWKLSWNKRFKQIDGAKTIIDILQTWPEYKQPLGYQLISIDFFLKFPNAKDLAVKWPLNQSKLYNLFQKRVDICSITTFLQKYNDCDEDTKIFATFWLLHYIFTPPEVSIAQSQESFAIIGKTLTELEDKLNSLKLPSQPCLLVLGDVYCVEAISLYFSGVNYVINNTLLAVDILFKSIFVFNLEYPKVSKKFYSFLQTIFYEMPVRYRENLTNKDLNDIRN